MKMKPQGTTALRHVTCMSYTTWSLLLLLISFFGNQALVPKFQESENQARWEKNGFAEFWNLNFGFREVPNSSDVSSHTPEDKIKCLPPHASRKIALSAAAPSSSHSLFAPRSLFPTTTDAKATYTLQHTHIQKGHSLGGENSNFQPVSFSWVRAAPFIVYRHRK